MPPPSSQNGHRLFRHGALQHSLSPRCLQATHRSIRWVLGVSGLHVNLQYSIAPLKSFVKHCSMLTGQREANVHLWQTYYTCSAGDLHAHRKLSGHTAWSIAFKVYITEYAAKAACRPDVCISFYTALKVFGELQALFQQRSMRR